VRLPSEIHRIYCYLGSSQLRSEDSFIFHSQAPCSVVIHRFTRIGAVQLFPPHPIQILLGWSSSHVWLDRGVSDARDAHTCREAHLLFSSCVYIRTANHGEGRCHRFDHLYSPRRIQYSPPSSLNWRSRHSRPVNHDSASLC